MTETDDIKARLLGLCSPGAEAIPEGERLTALVVTGQQAAAHITRLEERCAALEGQVEAGAAEIERLKKEADGKFVQAAVNVMQRYPGFEWRDYTPDGISAEDFEEFFTEDLNEAWRVSEREKARAEAAEREVAALKEEVGRLREAIAAVTAATSAYLPPDGIDASTCISLVLAATDNPKINSLMLESGNGCP